MKYERALSFKKACTYQKNQLIKSCLRMGSKLQTEFMYLKLSGRWHDVSIHWLSEISLLVTGRVLVASTMECPGYTRQFLPLRLLDSRRVGKIYK